MDDTLAGIELVEMQRHTNDCPGCARRDANIRRALLLARNLPTIQPSPGFAFRLEARLAESLLLPTGQGAMRKRVAAAATLAAAAMIGFIATTLYRVESPRDLMMAPIIASVPESEIMPISSPPAAIVASASAGLAIWPAAVFAEQAPVHFAHVRFAT
ncbi:MAG TPA: hypothetical protein VHL58_11725, partial [Thermoanaerobaculia bacterium]|nr:hypothetical protein [Thermoanaerobaculia bacterium]